MGLVLGFKCSPTSAGFGTCINLNQKVISCFLNALIASAARMGGSNMLVAMVVISANAHVGDTQRETFSHCVARVCGPHYITEV